MPVKFQKKLHKWEEGEAGCKDGEKKLPQILYFHVMRPSSSSSHLGLQIGVRVES